MKKITSLLTVSLLFLTACGTEQAMSIEDQAAKYGMTVERYREEKAAAARMNMSWEEHVKMIQGNGHMDHDMH
ncbi:hypothetical protein HOF56_02265 [Candidatus Peribacteria bacterium]|jgi:hypothetical protein|nr:hypothetical protein [Candidatus Peribacteria bacterium]MBT4021561.1 hypothetical protein [Candidatus Peribacteria bacterium]MBT4240585.1 hypothetical protein [Candidatus Peribacteria bacterium]MBT4474680.1 hypothetical protein [Candidatus Peribacteria bacterium]